MKSATRLSTSVTSVGHKSLVARGFVCLQCRHRSALAAQRGALSTSVPIPPQRHASSTSSIDALTGKIRRKLWGTDNPPGQEDPYGGLSISEQKKSKVKKDPVAVAENAPGAGVVPSDTAASNYVPATTWDGLDQVGGATGWWEDAWDEKHPFRGFMEPTKMTAREEIEAAVRRAVIEVFTLRDAERSLTDAVNATNDRVTPNLEIVAFTESGDGSVVLNFLGPHVRQEILDSMDLSRGGPMPEVSKMQPTDEVLETEDVLEDTTGKVNKQLNATAARPDGIMADAEASLNSDSTTQEGPWREVPLGDTDVKFAVLKRVMQLTGVRIPDHAITDINTAKALVGHLVKKPKPKKLAGSLLVNEKLTALPNLQIFDRRYTPIDREKEVGRWKVIEKELQRRGLPVTGTA